MASLINPSNIDGTYPIAGQDNDSQGFRNNFTNIKDNLTVAQTEITALQQVIAVTTGVQYVAPATGATIQVSASASALIIDPVDAIYSVTVVMPANPADGALANIGFGRDITTVSMTGGTIYGQIVKAVSGTFGKWMYSTGGSAWFRIG